MTNKQFNSTGLLKPQIEHSIRLNESLEVNNIAHDASGTGQGKTYCAAAVLRHQGRKFIVISPKLNIPKWHAVLKEFGLKAEFVGNYEKIARGNLKKIYRYNNKCPKYIPHFLRGEFRIDKNLIVVLDESHRAKGMDSLNAGMLYALKNQGYTTLCLSATQAMTPLDMRAFGYATGLHKGMTLIQGRGENFGMNLFKRFAEDAGAEYVGKWGAMYFDSEKPESVEKLQAVREELFNVKKISSKMNRADFGNIFPQNQIEAVNYDMGENGKKIARIYDQMQAELAQLEDRCQNYAQHILAIITKARRHAELLKVPSLEEMVEDLMEENKSVIVFLNYQDSIDALVSRLAKKLNKKGKELIGQIHGQQTMKQRFEHIADFQADKKRVMVANLAAGAESIDLQDITGKHPRANLINPSYRAIAVVQSIGRPDRAYAKSDVLTRLVLADGTIEVSVGERFNDKKGALEILNDGDLTPNGARFRMVAGMDI